MRWLKSAYAGVARDVAHWPAVAPAIERAGDTDKDGWRFWAASLTAIYDIDRMVRLDIPWWNVAATRAVETFLAARPRPRVFEYGSGASTAWLARRAASVVSVEHEAAWGEQVDARIAGFPNARLLHRPLSVTDDPSSLAYVRAIEESEGPFDLIVVDGRHRAVCLAAAIPHLAPGGYILFDDSGRHRYRAAIGSCGLIEQHHFGRSYCVPYPDHSSLIGPKPAR